MTLLGVPDIPSDRCPRCGYPLEVSIGEDFDGTLGTDRYCGGCAYADLGEPWTREAIRERIRFALGDS